MNILSILAEKGVITEADIPSIEEESRTGKLTVDAVLVKLLQRMKERLK
jgi:hypothetical protein